MSVAAITVELSPALELGPLTLAWHGLMIAAGIAVGAALARLYAIERGLDVDQLWNAIGVMILAGIVGSRLYFLAENDAGDLLRPGEWLGDQGFAFYGAMIAGGGAVALYLWRSSLSVRYLDAMAAGFFLGMAVGRIGDLILGEHYGPATDAPWGSATPIPTPRCRRSASPISRVPSTRSSPQRSFSR